MTKKSEKIRIEICALLVNREDIYSEQVLMLLRQDFFSYEILIQGLLLGWTEPIRYFFNIKHQYKRKIKLKDYADLLILIFLLKFTKNSQCATIVNVEITIQLPKYCFKFLIFDIHIRKLKFLYLPMRFKIYVLSAWIKSRYQLLRWCISIN